MTPEEILNKHSVVSMGPTSDLLTAMKDYARQFALQVAGDAWDASELYQRKWAEFRKYDNDEIGAPDRTAYIASLQLPEQQGWMDISSAPKDGTKVDLWFGDSRRVNCWNSDGHWVQRMGPDQLFVIKGIPTHWQPLPLPPSPPITKQ